MSVGVEGTSSFALMDEWRRDLRRADRINHASWRDPASKLLGLRRRHLDCRLVDVPRELARRYKGIMYQVLRRSGRAEGILDSKIVEAFQTTLTALRETKDERKVPGVLWAGCMASCGTGSVECFKPKFMLRAFVDEIPPCGERLVLRSLAYGQGTEQRPHSDEVMALLVRALGLLHRQVLQRSSELAELSDRGLEWEQVRALAHPYDEYKTWLFLS
jgi:hypothetical protein